MTPEEIKNIRRSLLLTQSEFASLLNIYQAAISDWEKGKRAPQQVNQEKIRRLMIKLNKGARIFCQHAKGNHTRWIVIDEKNILDCALKKIAFTMLFKEGYPVHLIKLDEDDFNEWIKGKKNNSSSLSFWARQYYQKKKYLQPKKEKTIYEYPWLSTYD